MKKAMMNTILVLSILIGLICVANAENNQLEFLQNLFHEYFPDYSYEDSYRDFYFPHTGLVGGLVQWKLYALRQNAVGFVSAAFLLPHCV